MRRAAACGPLCLMASVGLDSVCSIVVAAVAAVLLAELLEGIGIPVVVLEILLGIMIGPQVLHWAEVVPIIDAFSQLGLALLMFLAGFEADPARIKGRPLNLAVAGWAVHLLWRSAPRAFSSPPAECCLP